MARFRKSNAQIVHKDEHRLFREISVTKPVDYLVEFDYFLLVIALAITVIGLIYLGSAMSNMYADGGTSAMRSQIAGLVVGVIFALVLAFFDYNLLKKITWPFFAVNVLLMLSVFTPLGVEDYGSRSWIGIGSFTYQPSELMKLAMVLVIAIELEKAQEEGFGFRRVAIISFAFLVPLGLIIQQKDMGQAMVLTFSFLMVLFVGRAKWWYVLSVLALGGAAIPFLWKFYLNGTRRARLFAFIDPEKYPDYSLQLIRSETAIGSGGLTGQGVGQGAMNGGKKILVKMSDSIFAVIGEEGGFIIAALVVLLFAVLLLRMCYISARARDMYGKCVAAGILAMFLFNIFENIGMNLGIMPITGLPLPFISKGGSAMITNYICIGLLLSVSLRRKREFFE
ncbi:MAG: rod shape-determining protein RodA [Clostridia bacterium]|nr:rod shape-determining protein RodA [Clostridia bacterium]